MTGADPDESLGQSFTLRGEHIALDSLLKAAGIASSGGDAKMSILTGDVLVNGRPETRRARKLRSGDVVVASGQCLIVRAADGP